MWESHKLTVKAKGDRISIATIFSCDESALVLPVTLSILFKEIHSIEEDGNLHAIADQPKQHEIAVAVGGVIQDADAHGRRIGSLQRVIRIISHPFQNALAAGNQKVHIDFFGCDKGGTPIDHIGGIDVDADIGRNGGFDVPIQLRLDLNADFGFPIFYSSEHFFMGGNLFCDSESVRCMVIRDQ